MTSPRTLQRLLLVLLLTTRAGAQVDLLSSPTAASLRGIDVSGPAVAWASGSAGTILRTEDAGKLWSLCSVPPGGEKLDFRGIQALDPNTAVIMSSGKGDLSRIYKTSDSCKTWTLVFKNSDPDGFFDAILRVSDRQIFILGDPVDGRFSLFNSQDAGSTWSAANVPGLDAQAGDGAFAASNSSLVGVGTSLFFGTGGTNLPMVYTTQRSCPPSASSKPTSCPDTWHKQSVPLASHNAAAGVFSLASRASTSASGKITFTVVAVGGTYDKPQDRVGTAARSLDNGRTWQPAAARPAGYRSAVAFDHDAGVWIAAGPSGIDLSRDDGLTWQPLTSASGPDRTQGWNAIAPPYLVGSRGRIGRLRGYALTSAKANP